MTTDEPGGVWGTFEWFADGFIFKPYATEADAHTAAANVPKYMPPAFVGFVPWGTDPEDAEF